MLFFSPPLCSKNKKKQQTPTHQDVFKKMWNSLRPWKALFSSPSFWVIWVVFSRVVFFLLLCPVKRKRNNKDPPMWVVLSRVLFSLLLSAVKTQKTTNTHPELFEGVKGPVFKRMVPKWPYEDYFLFSPPLYSKPFAQANLTHICNTSPHFALVGFRRYNSLPNKFLSKADVYKN